MKVSDRALNRLRAQTEGLPLPEEIYRIPARLGLTQEATGELIGGGPGAFQTYEAGDLSSNRTVGSALALLDHDPAGLSVLHSRAVSADPNLHLAGITRAIDDVWRRLRGSGPRAPLPSSQAGSCNSERSMLW